MLICIGKALSSEATSCKLIPFDQIGALVYAEIAGCPLPIIKPKLDVRMTKSRQNIYRIFRKPLGSR